MKKNIGTKDRLLRLAVAFLLTIGAWWFHSWILFAAALFVFYEAAASWCIWYFLIGKSSCPLDKNKK